MVRLRQKKIGTTRIYKRDFRPRRGFRFDRQDVARFQDYRQCMDKFGLFADIEQHSETFRK